MLRWLKTGLVLLLAIALYGCVTIDIAIDNPTDATRASETSEMLETPETLETSEFSELYDYRRVHSPDGIGKFYMGREIAKVMGHTEALWLERPSRSETEQPDEAIALLDLAPTDTVADIGAGTGYFSFRMAAQLSEGAVYAVDVQPEMINILDFLIDENQAQNVQPVLGDATDPHLPSSSIDLALMVDAYHEFAYPREMMTHVVEALKPGGRVALLEYRKENPLIPIKGLHKMTERQARREMEAVGLEWLETSDRLPQQHLMLFQKPVA
jgi:SAM-dependent methyltransferase